MIRLLSCIQKDIRLLIGSGLRTVVTLLLPVLLIVVMFFGMSDLANQRAQLPTFSVAVVDLDQTLMSAILIGQLGEIELFDTIIRIEPSEEDIPPHRKHLEGYAPFDESPLDTFLFDPDVLFNEYHVAAILTIPRDFFFSLYDMRNFTVEIILNGNMPLESSIFQSLTTSIMDIISENQQTMWAVHHLKYGELDQVRRAELFRQASFLIVEDALGRQGVFAPDQVLVDDASSAAIFLYGSIMILFSLYIPLSILKTLPEELALGILPRYLAKGGSMVSFISSKLITAFFLCFGIWILLTVAIFPFSILKAFLIFLICFLGSFSLFLFLSTLIKESSHSQIVGNIILLLFMILGGGLYPLQMLPDALHIFSRFTISYYFMIGLSGLGLDFPLISIFVLLLPVVFATVFFTTLSFILLKYASNKRRILTSDSGNSIDNPHAINGLSSDGSIDLAKENGRKKP